ncbi:MAG: nucleotidyltransferase domain-containing protein [Bacteroidales bacterium]|nr:nucleotidyltransferase domain-containing protein [Bacteroidales bacterium]
MDAKVKRIISNYFKTRPVEKAWVFGSYSRGEETPESDIDILVTLLPDAHMGLSFFEMIVDLEHLLNRPVDLVVDGCLLPFAAETANSDKILIYDRASQRSRTADPYSSGNRARRDLHQWS